MGREEAELQESDQWIKVKGAYHAHIVVKLVSVCLFIIQNIITSLWNSNYKSGCAVMQTQMLYLHFQSLYSLFNRSNFWRGSMMSPR